MSTSIATDGIRLRWQLVPNDAPEEIAVFSMYTGKRDESNYPALVDEMEDWLIGISGSTGGIINGYTGASLLFVDEFANPLVSQSSWGTIYSRNVTGGVADGGGTLPFQCAWVITRDTDDNELPRNRRKNRTYIGPLADNFLGPDGRMSISGTNALLTKTQVFHNSLQGVPVASGTPSAYGGLCNVSYRGTTFVGSPPQITNSTQLRVGRVIDTQRRRRNALTEAYELVPLNVPT